jgi:pimeloyl-ACP methyl ester carboxylesterase
MSDYQEHRILTEGISLEVREYPREGEALLCLHFGGGNLMMWQRVVPAFQKHYHLVLADLRDHGRSDKPQTGDNIDQMARDLVGVLDQLDLERVHVLGSSLGAEVGLSLVANHSKRVRSLICDGALTSEFGPCGIWQGSEETFREHVAQTLAGIRDRQDETFPSIEALVAARKKYFVAHGMWNDTIEAFLAYDAHPLGDGSFTRSWQHQARFNYMQAYYNYRFEAYYRRVKCPVLMVTGDEAPENEFETKAMQAMSKIPHNGKLVVVPGWQHPYGWMLDPEMMVRVVLDFLGGLG